MEKNGGRHRASQPEPGWIRRHIKGLAGSSLAVIALTATAASSALLFKYNDGKAAQAAGIATSLAENRNTCHLDNATVISQAGRKALRATISVTPHDDPSRATLGGFGMQTNFSDGKGNLESGILVKRHTASGNADAVALGSEGGQGFDAPGPEESPQSITIGFPLVDQTHEARYDFLRQNAIKFKVHGPLVSDQISSSIGAVSCGSVQFNPQAGTLKQLAVAGSVHND